jgi:Tfp pilus assembly protein PilZ
MERRIVSQRRPRRARVQFWKRGETEATTGFTSNVSTSGMFVGTNTPLPRGTRVRIEVMEPPGLFLEGVVAHAVKVAPGLQRVRQSGMGIRFLRGDEVLAELLAPPPPPPPKTAPAAPEPPPAPIEEGPPKGLVYPVRFGDAQQLLEAFRRDLRNGGMFVATKYPAPLNTHVTVEIVPPADGTRVRLPGAVTSVRPAAECRGLEQPGMGVLFDDPQDVIAQLLPVVAESQEGESGEA